MFPMVKPFRFITVFKTLVLPHFDSIITTTDGWTDQRTNGHSLLKSCVAATKKGESIIHPNMMPCANGAGTAECFCDSRHRVMHHKENCR